MTGFVRRPPILSVMRRSSPPSTTGSGPTEIPATVGDRARLAEYEKWAGASRIDLNARELQFLGASLQAREREVRADQERTEREVRLDRRARRRLWAAVAAAITLVVIVGGLVVATVLNDTTRVAVVTSGEEDALSKLLIRGVEQAAADLPVEIMDVIPPITDLGREYRRLAAAGVELIIVPAGLDGGEMYDIAAEMPDVTFVTVMGFEMPGSPNVVAVEFADEQVGFLAGVAAAAETKTRVVGFVGGAAVPDVETRRAGFEAGVAFVDPSVTVLARHVSANGDGPRAFQRTDLGKAASGDLFDLDADVIYHAAGRSGFGVFQAAREQTEDTLTKHWGIGSDSDQILEVGALEQDYVLFSVLRKFDVVASSTVHDLLNGDLDAGTVRYTLADDGLGYSTRGNHLSDLAVSRVAQAEASIIDGAVAIPLVPVGDVLPPLEAPVPVGTVEIRHDGSQCSHRYSGPTVVAPGESIRIVVVNDGAVMPWAGAFVAESDLPASMVRADPGRTQVGYFVATDGPYVLSCGVTELMTLEVA